MTAYGAQRLELVLQPVSGKALPVYQGEVLRIIQVEGEQCVDFNAFNLHDHKEHMDVSMSRGSTGFRPKKADLIFSNPPRYRPMIAILEMPSTCVTDVLGRTCNAVLFEASHGFELHTNCQDTMAECIAEYGLTPDDVHHSFNMWMNSEWDSTGRWWIVRNTGRRGDYVDLLAIFDTLMVPQTCGGGDVGLISNFSFKPIKLEVFGASEATLELVEKVVGLAGSFRNQRTPDRFRVNQIKTDRELRPVPGFQPNFVNYPIRVEPIEVPLSGSEQAMAERLVQQGEGNDIGDIVRRAFMMWYQRHRTRPRNWVRIPASWL